MVKHLIIKHLTILSNQCLDTGVFPDNLENAEVKPFYIKTNKHLFTNYKPISLLPSLSKIHERVIYSEIVQKQFAKQSSNHKYGFRSNHSTEHTALHFYNEIKNICNIYRPI